MIALNVETVDLQSVGRLLWFATVRKVLKWEVNVETEGSQLPKRTLLEGRPTLRSQANIPGVVVQ